MTPEDIQACKELVEWWDTGLLDQTGEFVRRSNANPIEPGNRQLTERQLTNKAIRWIADSAMDYEELLDSLEEAQRIAHAAMDERDTLEAKLREREEFSDTLKNHWIKMKKERNALAAHVKHLRDLCDYWILAGKPGPAPTKEAYNVWLALGYHSKAWNETPATSLARLKAEWCESYAERFMELADNARENGYMAQADAVDDMAEELKDEATQLHRQAKGGES